MGNKDASRQNIKTKGIDEQSMNKTMLIVDDEKSTRDGLRMNFKSDYTVYVAENGEKALEILQQHAVDIMLTDLRMEGINGLELMRIARNLRPETLVIMLTAYGSVETAVEAMKEGATDYVEKPVNLDELEIKVKRALEKHDIAEENRALKQRIQKNFGFESILGNSDKMKAVFETIKQIAPTRANVLIEGESGTGKELVANAIHNISPRKNGPFIPVHCAALAKTLLESELFGHEKGAFTGAISQKEGKFERANGGTLFLDEISEVDLDIQVKLLRFLEKWEFERVGGSRLLQVDLRLITATNKELSKLVAEGRFREDLYYRLRVVNIKLPPLRERKSDIPILIKAFMTEFASQNNKRVASVSPEAMQVLTEYPWPGNVRELKNAIESAIVFARSDTITLSDLPLQLKGNAVEGIAGSTSPSGTAGKSPVLLPAGTSLQDAEKMLIEETLRNAGFNISRASRVLNISRRTLHRKINEYKLREKFAELKE
jgi:two-component system, NtrC family, response regulator AtoC